MRSVRKAVFQVLMLGALIVNVQSAHAETPSSAGASGNPPPTGRWSDNAEIVVHPGSREFKRCPAMYKLRRGNSVLLVLPTLTTVPDGLKWDSSCFETSLAGANALIMPGVFEGVTSDRRTLPGGKKLKDVVSPATYARFLATAKKQKASPGDFDYYTPQWAGARMVSAVYLKRHLHNETFPDKLPGLARRANIQVRLVPPFEGDEWGYNSRNRLDAAGAEACLNSYLDRLDYTLDALPVIAEAWSQSDMATVLKLFPEVGPERCSPPGETFGLDVLRTNMQRWTDAMDAALYVPGKTVAVVPIEWLLNKGGALDQLKASGVDIISPAEGED